MSLIPDLALMLELAEHGSFSVVGRRQDQAPSSVARRLDRLEAMVGERLFNRTPKGLFLTTTGARKLSEARALVAAAEAFVAARPRDGALKGGVALTAPSRLGAVCVAPIVASFLAEHPEISVDLHLTDAFQDLDRDRIDIAVRIGGDAPGHHRVRRIADNRRVLVASPAYVATRPPIATPEDLRGCDGVVLGAAPVWRLRDAAGRRVEVTPRARVRCVAGDAVTTLCEAGLGVALKSYWDVRGSLMAGRMVQVLPDWTQADGSEIVLTTPSNRLVSPAARAMAQALERGLRPLVSE